MDLGAAVLLTPEVVSAISSFMRQGIPRHPNSRRFEVREAYAVRHLVFRLILAHISQLFRLRRTLQGPLRGLARLRRATGISSHVALRTAEAEPLMNALAITV